MRRLLLASCIALLPGLAFAQNAPPPPGGPMGPPPGGPECGGGPGGPGGPGHGWKDDGHGWHHFMDPAAFLNEFYAANTSHNGHLTLAQAKAANFKPVADHFAEIDVKKKGYVTFYDIEAWHLDQAAHRLEKCADELRSKD